MVMTRPIHLKKRLYVIYGATLFELKDYDISLFQDNEIYAVSMHELIMENAIEVEDDKIGPVIMPLCYKSDNPIPLQTMRGFPKIDEYGIGDDHDDDHDDDNIYSDDDQGDDSIL